MNENSPKIKAVYAHFINTTETSFFDLFNGFTSLRVLTYSGSIRMVRKAAQIVDELEVIFGREDVIKGTDDWFAYVAHIRNELRDDVKSDLIMQEKVANQRVKVLVGRNSKRHEKVYLLKSATNYRVITGSANFSELAFSGRQGETLTIYDKDPNAWQFYSELYESIKIEATPLEPESYLVADVNDPKNHPIILYMQKEMAQGAKPAIIIDEPPPEDTFLDRYITINTPKVYIGLGEHTGKVRGEAKRIIDRKALDKMLPHMEKQNIRKDNYSNLFLSIYPEMNLVELSGKLVSLEVNASDIAKDVSLWLDYFSGYQHFHGDVEKLAKNYFLYMSWFYASPFLCDYRNRALLKMEGYYLYDYPLYTILYGKSNCGKTSLNRTLLYSMFQLRAELPVENFTEAYVKRSVMLHVRRFPIICEDITTGRITEYAKPLIRDEVLRHKEYPGIVLSTNEDVDALESAIRKRCLVIYTGASLEDYGDRARELTMRLEGLTSKFTGALYKAYLTRIMPHLDKPLDLIELSSKTLTQLFAEHSDTPLPNWCGVIKISDYRSDKYDNIRDDLYNLWLLEPQKWEVVGKRALYHADTVHVAGKYRKDVPDNLLEGNTRGTTVAFNAKKLSEFIGVPIRTDIVGRFSRWMARRRM